MKKQKIVITGGLGYIGSELCKLYSGETRFKEIIVTDIRFVSERVKQLNDWGFTFIQSSILDKQTMRPILENADIVHHLAGITDVAYTKTDSNLEEDKQIQETAIGGTNNILELIPSTCKIVFPSTHVVYEGFDVAKFDITEEEPPTPKLAYSKGKTQNEIDIKASGRDHVILRLASVYGYSTDTMRMNIMPNLFSRMASQNSTIKLFSGGIQHKSLIGLIDVARAFKFMGDGDIKNETFHLSNETTTIKEVADICKKHNPLLNIISTDDEIPNLGYTISNKKLLKTGFNFLYNLDDSIKEMISNWSPRDINPGLEFIQTGGNEYIDDRGSINNYELTEPINLMGYIKSVKGSVRANHYHPIQEQKCLLVKGKYVSVIKDLADPKAKVQTQIISEGDIAVIKPNVAHTMVFLEDSTFLNLVRGEREHENYGITHTIPYELVDEKFRIEIMENYSSKCRSCGSGNLKPVISLGLSPLANNLLDSLDDDDELYPLEMVFCPDSYNCQLSYVVPANKMFDHYLYVSSTAKSFRDHFEQTAKTYITDFKLTGDSTVVDIGSNDGVALKPLQDRGIKVLGVEPAKNICDLAIKRGIPTINKYFTKDSSQEIESLIGKVDLVTASNVFAHADGLDDIVDSAFSLLKPNGSFIVEVQYLLDTLQDLTFDNIYHEHVNYWSVTSMKNFFHRLGYNIYKVEHIDTHGGSIRVYVNNNTTIHGMKHLKVKHPSVAKFLLEEETYGLKDYNTYLKFAERVEKSKSNVLKNIKSLKNQGLTLVGYGSPAKATTSLNYYGITTNEIDYIVEDNELKHNKILPGVKIPIYAKSKVLLAKKLPDVIIVLAWNFFEDIKRNNKELIDKGVRFINIKDLQND